MKKSACSLIVLLLIGVMVKAQTLFSLQGVVRNPNRQDVEIRLLDEPLSTTSRKIRVPLSRGKFELKIPLQRPTLILITDGVNYLNGAIEPGQELMLGYDAAAEGKQPEVYGTAAASFKLIYQLSKDGINVKLNKKMADTPKTPAAYDILLHFIDSIQDNFISRLDSIKPVISKSLYQFMLAEVKGTFIYKRYNAVSSIDNITATRLLESGKAFSNRTTSYLRSVLHFDDEAGISPTYVSNAGNILQHAWELRDTTIAGDNSSLRFKYEWFTQFLTGSLRMPVLANLLSNDLAEIKERDDIEPYIGLMGTPVIGFDYRDIVRTKYKQLIMLYKGQPAFDFALPDENGHFVALSSLRGKVVYIDFWFAGCMPCLSLFERLRPVKAHFKNDRRVVFLSISIDDPNTWKKTLARLKLEGLHVNAGTEDVSKTVLKRYQVYSYPTTYLIDANGNVANADPPGPDGLIQEIEKWLPTSNPVFKPESQ